jgi:magnesium chelatase subunit H
MDSHLGGAFARATDTLRRELPNLELVMHAADEWGCNPEALKLCQNDIASADIVIATMLFLDEHVRAVMPALQARRDNCDAIVCCLSAGEIVRLTRVGRFDMSKVAGGALAWLKRLRGKSGSGTSGQGQMKSLRQLPKLLKFIPGTAQDVRAYFLTLQYWLAGSEENLANMVRLLVDRYAAGPRKELAGALKVAAPVEYPDVGLYHPAAKGRIFEKIEQLPSKGRNGRVGVLLLRSYALSSNAEHYDGVITALEEKGLQVIPAFSSGLDQREAVERYFLQNGKATVDAVVSLTGFSLVGGPAYNDARSAEELLTRLDVPYITAHPVEFQTLEQWKDDPRGLLPVEATMMVAIPELDGGIWPMTFGGRSGVGDHDRRRDMVAQPERAAMLANRVARIVSLRRKKRAERKIAVVLFNFPPNAGTVGSAAYPSVFRSLRNIMLGMKAEGYTIDVPESPDALREKLLGGNSQFFGSNANVVARMPADDHVRKQRWLDEIEAQWGPTAPRCSSWASISATSSSACSRPSATKATRCACCSSTASPRRMRSAPSTAGSTRSTTPTRCCISAPMARWSSCPASRPACPAIAGPTG